MAQKPTILIVENNDNVRKTLHDWLSLTFSTCNILQTATGEEAIALAVTEHLDIILMDIGLPGISGLDAMRQILELHPTVAVVVISIHETPDYQEDAATGGAIAFIPKHKMYTDLAPILKKTLASLPHNKDNPTG